MSIRRGGADEPERFFHSRATVARDADRSAGGWPGRSAALELALEDAKKWCSGLSEERIHARPAGLPSVAFQLRHIAGSLDRLLTYAEGRALSEEQLQALKAEANSEGTTKGLLIELEAAI